MGVEKTIPRDIERMIHSLVDEINSLEKEFWELYEMKKCFEESANINGAEVYFSRLEEVKERWRNLLYFFAEADENNYDKLSKDLESRYWLWPQNPIDCVYKC